MPDTAQKDRTPTNAIIDALANAANVDPLALPPLYDSIDTEALNQLFADYDGANAEALMSFSVDDWNVFVRRDGQIRV